MGSGVQAAVEVMALVRATVVLARGEVTAAVAMMAVRGARGVAAVMVGDAGGLVATATLAGTGRPMGGRVLDGWCRTRTL